MKRRIHKIYLGSGWYCKNLKNRGQFDHYVIDAGHLTEIIYCSQNRYPENMLEKKDIGKQ